MTNNEYRIIIASHANLLRVFISQDLIFGEQEKVQVVTLAPK